MTDFRGNIDHWLRQSEPDYYLFFLKAWIPFNAWYVAELPHLDKKDTKIIKELQDNANSKPRQIIENYLCSNRYDSNKFKSHLAELHHYLESKSLKHNGIKLSFTNLFLSENPKKFEKAIDKHGNIFRAEVKPGYFEIVMMDKGGRTKLHIRQTKYSLNDIEKENDFIKLNDKKIQNRLIQCYDAINPQKSISLVTISKIKYDYIPLYSENQVNFINDPTIIAKACIKILYSLRCMLFHGEVEPTPTNKPIYEHAYFILRLILKEL